MKELLPINIADIEIFKMKKKPTAIDSIGNFLSQLGKFALDFMERRKRKNHERMAFLMVLTGAGIMSQPIWIEFVTLALGDRFTKVSSDGMLYGLGAFVVGAIFEITCRRMEIRNGITDTELRYKRSKERESRY